MNYKQFGKLLHTVYHLKPTQIFYQICYRLYKPKYKKLDSPAYRLGNAGGIPRPTSLRYNGKTPVFSFLNIDSPFKGWNDTTHGMLYAYNLNYMDWLNQSGMTEIEGVEWIDRFIDELPDNHIGLDPYPTALRIINWIKFFNRYPKTATPHRLDSLYSQVMLLNKKLEYHILANHLLEDAFALYIASSFFEDPNLKKKSKKLLYSQLKEQILRDGSHYEQSPMYHCIMLDRLLDAINISGEADSLLINTAQRMTGHLKAIMWHDDTLPLFNDSATGIAPLPSEILEYANKLGITSDVIELKECGFRRMTDGQLDVIIDAGNITASYQPGHTHADTFTYELRINGKPFIVDTGITTYDKNKRRQYERSTIAHNTVTPLDNSNSSEVWGGFRVGKRARIIISEDKPQSLIAVHDGYGNNWLHKRRFLIKDKIFEVFDYICNNTTGISRIHLSPDVKILNFNNNEVTTSSGIITIYNAVAVTVSPCMVARAYNQPLSAHVIEIVFNTSVHYKICPTDN